MKFFIINVLMFISVLAQANDEIKEQVIQTWNKVGYEVYNSKVKLGKKSIIIPTTVGTFQCKAKETVTIFKVDWKDFDCLTPKKENFGYITIYYNINFVSDIFLTPVLQANIEEEERRRSEAEEAKWSGECLKPSDFSSPFPIEPAGIKYTCGATGESGLRISAFVFTDNYQTQEDAANKALSLCKMATLSSCCLRFCESGPSLAF